MGDTVTLERVGVVAGTIGVGVESATAIGNIGIKGITISDQGRVSLIVGRKPKALAWPRLLNIEQPVRLELSAVVVRVEVQLHGVRLRYASAQQKSKGNDVRESMRLHDDSDTWPNKREIERGFRENGLSATERYLSSSKRFELEPSAGKADYDTL